MNGTVEMKYLFWKKFKFKELFKVLDFKNYKRFNFQKSENPKKI